jgi:hypothetical protein
MVRVREISNGRDPTFAWAAFVSNRGKLEIKVGELKGWRVSKSESFKTESFQLMSCSCSDLLEYLERERIMGGGDQISQASSINCFYFDW